MLRLWDDKINMFSSFLQDPQSTDAGQYKCNIKNNEGETNANLALNFETVEEEPPPPSDKIAPVLLEKPKIIPNQDASKVAMEVKIKAKPEPKATWSKAGATIREGSTFSINAAPSGDNTYIFRLEVRVRKKLQCWCMPENQLGANLFFKIDRKNIFRTQEAPKLESINAM